MVQECMFLGVCMHMCLYVCTMYHHMFVHPHSIHHPSHTPVVLQFLFVALQLREMLLAPAVLAVLLLHTSAWYLHVPHA